MFVVVTEAAAARWAALTRAPQPTGRGVSSVMGDDTGVYATKIHQPGAGGLLVTGSGLQNSVKKLIFTVASLAAGAKEAPSLVANDRIVWTDTNVSF